MDPLIWQPLDLPDGRALTYRGVEVARLFRRDGRHWAVLHYPEGQTVTRPCTSFDRGQYGIMLWAMRYRTPLTHAIDRRLDAEKSDRPANPDAAP